MFMFKFIFKAAFSTFLIIQPSINIFWPRISQYTYFYLWIICMYYVKGKKENLRA